MKWGKTSDPGLYWQRMQWLRRSVIQEPTYGQNAETFTASGILWTWIEELSAEQRSMYGQQKSEATVRVHVHNRPSIDPKDRLRDEATGDDYVIDGINEVWDELRIEAHRLVQNLT